MTQKVMPAAASVTTAWTYLLDGNIDTLTDDNGTGNILDYGYDTADRPTSVKTKIPSLPGNKTTSYALDADGNRTKLTWPGTGGPYQFYLADGARGERDDPLGQAPAARVGLPG